MKYLALFLLLPAGAFALQTFDLHQVRVLYQKAALVKNDAEQFNKLLSRPDSHASPVIDCYRGANEMIQAKYTLNPVIKLTNFNKGKALIEKGISRDTTDLEMHFIRYSIQMNLPAFLGYHDDLVNDKNFMLENTRTCNDAELRGMIIDYLSGLTIISPEELKRLKN